MDIAPRLLLAVPRRIQNSRTVHTALANRSWLNDIQGALTVEVLADYLDLWDAIITVNINPIERTNTFLGLPIMANTLPK
jgi:hypothetical protein